MIESEEENDDGPDDELKEKDADGVSTSLPQENDKRPDEFKGKATDGKNCAKSANFLLAIQTRWRNIWRRICKLLQNDFPFLIYKIFFYNFFIFSFFKPITNRKYLYVLHYLRSTVIANV